jgi:proteasome assembly chaperone (PAC2) family protein
VGETKSISMLLETLKIKSNQTSYEERAKQLENLLRAVLEDKGISVFIFTVCSIPHLH